ncbi:MAG: hypothetical protein LBD16_05020 [Oscillospiraceae bacterium]|jgi:predicted nucleic acid-binding protein|nr:hypothetical protein [Oscillospiraceae bacterium]
MEKKLRVYMDNCCYNRPFDDQRQRSVQLETQAKLWIQEAIKNDTLELVVSFMLHYENSFNKNREKAYHITEFFKNAVMYVDNTLMHDVAPLRDVIMATGIKQKDATHLASAIIAKVDYFITTDKRILKYNSSYIKTINPVDFIRRWEELGK